jgi:hypothetical protein
MRPDRKEYADFYHNYILSVEEENAISAVLNSAGRSEQFWNAIPSERGLHRYEDGKWSINQIISHVIDTERIFCYRALSIARGETTPLPGYDHDSYVWNSRADLRSLDSLRRELAIVRQSSLSLFNSFDSDQLGASGVANNNPISVRSIGFILVGHELHHSKVIRERYL